MPVKVSRHPDADSLYVEVSPVPQCRGSIWRYVPSSLSMPLVGNQQKIDVGEETGPRTVCSGLVKYMKEEDILGQSLVIVVRLLWWGVESS